jgi:hypothetical protein
MPFTLPRLTTDVDCAAIGYPDLAVRFWLNPPIEEYAPPWVHIQDAMERRRRQQAEPWLGEYYHALARQIEAVTVPGAMTADGQDEVVTIQDGRSLWELEHRADFDPQILVWATNQYVRLRSERLRIELKN